MTRKPEPAALTRRKPRQARSVNTTEMIFEATARIIEREGAAALNTNHIAERAGIAIGTLYGYFPNKQAILLAMARRELERTHGAIRTAINTPGSRDDIGRAMIRALIRGFGGRNRVRRVLLETIVAHGHYADLARPVEDLAQLLMTRADDRPPMFPGEMPGEIQAFVLTRAVIGVIRAAVFEESPLMGTPALEDELVRLARCYVGAVAPDGR